MADKIVKLVDKNSNNLYPVAGSVIDNAVSTGAISSQAVNNAKIENGAVNGVENNATAIGTAKLALDTVGTPNLRDASVTSDKIDFTTIKINPKFMQSGKITAPLAIDGTTGNIGTITFPVAFDNIPSITATMQLATGKLGSVTLGSVDTAGATVLCRSATNTGTTTNRDVYWTAIDPTQPPLIAA